MLQVSLDNSVCRLSRINSASKARRSPAGVSVVASAQGDGALPLDSEASKLAIHSDVGCAAGDPALVTIVMTASYLSIEITSALSAAARHQYRTRPDPVTDPGHYVLSDEAGHVAASMVYLVGVPKRTALILESRLWVDGGYDSGWFDTGLVFDTPGKYEGPYEYEHEV